MSTILRALKKLEHDKASRKPDPADMDLEFLDSTAPASRRSPLKGIVLVGLLVACGSAATYLFMSHAEKVPFPPPTAAPQARQVVFTPATSARPAMAPLANRSSAAASPAVTASPLQAQQKPAPAPLAVPPSRDAAKKLSEPQNRTVPTAQQHAPQTPRTPRITRTQDSTTALPSLTVNGIALSDGEKRKAIVNGMSVSVGSVIEGARVEDIQENRVRFSHGGKSFEISVGNTGP